jgi:hypothetical protein
MEGNIGIDPGIPLKVPDSPQIKTSTEERRAIYSSSCRNFASPLEILI